MFEEMEDQVFLKVLRANVSPHVVTREVDANLEDEAFAEAVIDACMEIFPRPLEKPVTGIFPKGIETWCEFFGSSIPDEGRLSCT